MILKYIKNICARLRIYKWRKENLAQGIIIKKPKMISDIAKIKFGKHIYIGPGAYIHSNGGLTIGDNVIISANFTCWTENHNYKNAVSLPYDASVILKPIVIESHTWIGLNVTLCPGTYIGEGAIIGMGSVVRGSIPPLAIVLGNPQKIVGYRDRVIYNKLKKECAFYLLSKYKSVL